MPFVPFCRSRALLSALLLWFLFLALLIAGSILLSQEVQGDSGRYVYGAIGTVAALVATAVVLRINKCAWADSGLGWRQRTGTKFIAGLAMGLALFGLTLLLIYIFTGIRPMPAHGLNAATLLLLGALLPLALMEELAFRGYAFAELRRQHGIWLAQFVTAVAFAAYHIFNGWPLLISLLGPGIWAFVFGIAAARSGGIAMPTGIHFGLNVAQALVGLGTATASVAAFQFTDANGMVGNAVAERTTPAGLAAQILFFCIALLLTYRFAKRTSAAAKPTLTPTNSAR